MRITNRPAPSAHPADCYPNLLRDVPAGRRRAAAAARADRAVRLGRYLPFGKTAATATPWEVDAAETAAAQDVAVRKSRQAWERDAPARRMSDAREQYDRETGGTPDPHVPPVLERNGARCADGFIPAIDQMGREYRVRLARGTVTVTFRGRSRSAAAGAAPTRTARELAGVLCGDYTPAAGPHAALARQLRGIAEELYALDPDRGSGRKIDYSGAAPVLLDAARLFDNERVTEGNAALARAARELTDWESDRYFRDHIGDRSRLTAGQARRYADTITALSRNAAPRDLHGGVRPSRPASSGACEEPSRSS